ncbi:unannotated protein [freshwater metagenome]|uniref:Unannotated protein n=1 Tax=freshwater metagenome TaxID=449393 RepID=A0A6J7IGT4_9ZZZZ|nr:amino acid permease [Actinomycetota bacterium]
MAQRRLHGLQRVLGVNALFSTAYGNVGSSIYYALGLVASLALGLTPLVFIISGFLFYLVASTYAEATAMYPEAGGSSSFARHAFNEFWSFFAAWAQMLNYTITIAISAFFVPHYIGGLFWEPLRSSPADIIFGVGVVVVLSIVNVVGAKESAGVNILLAVLDFATQILLVLVGVLLVFSPNTLIDNVQFGIAPTWKDFFIAIPVGMIAYTGIETISNMAEEAKDERRTIPKAINRVVVAVFAIYAVLPAVALSALPVTKQPDGSYSTLLGLPESQGGFAGDPILGVVKQISLGPFQGAAEIYVGLLAATILVIATNAGIIGVSRLVYSMGVHRQVPDAMRRLHPRFGTPWIGIVMFGAIACVAMIPGKADFLGNMYAFGAMLSFTIANLAVIQLRRTKADVERPFRGPGNMRFRGVDVPLFAVFGAIGTGLAFLVVTFLHIDVAAAGITWLVVGCVFYPLFRRHHGLSLTETVRIEQQVSLVAHEAEYESVLLVLDPRTYSPGALATAVRMAARRRRGIHLLVPIVVPASSPIDAEMPEQEAAAQAMIERARLEGSRQVTGRWQKVRAGQAGRLIIDEALQLRARAIVMPLPPRQAGAVFGRTLETVLQERPCRVIIQTDPEARRAPAPSRSA